MNKDDVVIGMKVTPFQKTANGWEENINEYKNHTYNYGKFLKENGYLFVIEYDEEEKAWILGDNMDNDGDYFNAEDFESYMDVNNISLEIDNVDFWSPHANNKGGMRIYWSSSIGFGTLDIVKRSGKGNVGAGFESPEEELILTADTECMDFQEDKSFTTKLLNLLVEKLEII